MVNHKSNSKQTANQNEIRTKRVYKPRESLITELYQIEHFKTLYRLFVAVLIWSLIYNVFLEKNRMKSCFYIISISLGQFHRGLYIWFLMCLCAFAVHPVFYYWAKFRIKLSPNSPGIIVWDAFSSAVWILFYLFLLLLPTYVISSNRLPFGTSIAVGMEQVRILMKVHSYIRSNISKVLKYKMHSGEEIKFATFSHYLYFFFIPTLIYRDSYPRTEKIRWNFMIGNFLDVIACVLAKTLISIYFILPSFEFYDFKHHNWRTFISAIFSTIFPGILLLFLTFYLLLHSWMNAWAEMLRFADRHFYSDWWNSTSYSSYFRRWNTVVYDFLHEYIYRDMYEIVVPGNKSIAIITVLLLSSLMHEFILVFSLNYFYPVISFEFGVMGLIFYSIRRYQNKLGNISFWITLLFGTGLFVRLYVLESFARLHCQVDNNNIKDFFIPKSWLCKPI